MFALLEISKLTTILEARQSGPHRLLFRARQRAIVSHQTVTDNNKSRADGKFYNLSVFGFSLMLTTINVCFSTWIKIHDIKLLGPAHKTHIMKKAITHVERDKIACP